MNGQNLKFTGMAGVLLLLLTGCISYDYIGMEFPEVPAATVSFYRKGQKVPQDEYTAVGRMKVTAPDGTDGYDLKEGLLEKAHEYGADAVSIVSVRRINAVTFDEFADSPGFSPLPLINETALTSEGDPYVINSFGQEVKNFSTRTGADYQVVAHAIFWKNKKTAEKIIAERRKRLTDIEEELSPVKLPAPPPKKEHQTVNEADRERRNQKSSAEPFRQPKPAAPAPAGPAKKMTPPALPVASAQAVSGVSPDQKPQSSGKPGTKEAATSAAESSRQ